MASSSSRASCAPRRRRPSRASRNISVPVAHRALRKAEKGASEHRRSVRPLALERYAHDAELGFDKVVAGHDQRNARRSLGCREVELADASMGVRRAQHVSVYLAVQAVVALETAVATQETLVLETPHRLPDSELAHYLTRSPCR